MPLYSTIVMNRNRWFFLIMSILTTGIGLAAYIQFAPMPRFDQSDRALISKTSMMSVDVYEGERIARTICVRCHFNPVTGALSGRQHPNPDRLGKFSSGNITNDSIHGIGKWSREDLAYFLRTGVRPDGIYIFDRPKYVHLSDRDLSSLVSFLKSDSPLVRAIPKETAAPQFSFPLKALVHFWLRPPKLNTYSVSQADTTKTVEWGRYLATAKFACFDCHSGNSMTNDPVYPEQSWRYFQGGNPHGSETGETIYAANLTPSVNSGIGKLTETEFVRMLKTGTARGGQPLRDPMFPFTLLSDGEARAIFAYLMTLEPIENKY